MILYELKMDRKAIRRVKLEALRMENKNTKTQNLGWKNGTNQAENGMKLGRGVLKIIRSYVIDIALGGHT